MKYHAADEVRSKFSFALFWSFEHNYDIIFVRRQKKKKDIAKGKYDDREIPLVH